MWEILQQITVSFFAIYGFYSVLLEMKTLLWQWYYYRIGRTNKENIFSDGIDKEEEK